MTTSAQKSALTSQVNLQDLQQMINVLKVLTLNAFTDEREKLQAFLVKLKLYIEFNQAKFRSEMNKGLFTVLYLKNAAFDWVNLKLHEFLDKTLKKQMNNKKFIFSNYKKFKNELWRAFRIVNKKQAAKRWLHILKMNKLTVKYAAEFQRIAALMNWDDDTLVLQYYWELNETIKDEIVRMNWPEELQNMINTFINIDSCQWEQQMKRTEHYTSKMWERHYTLRRGDPMNLDAIEKHCEQWSQVKQERCMSKLYKPQPQWVKTCECYNCEKPKHLARTCKKPQQERKEVTATDTHVVHDALSWTACYDDMCWTHMSSKDRAEWYSQRLKKKQNDYDTTGQLKRLTILKKAEIKETDTHKTQVEEDYSDSTWIALNLNANSKDVNNWEIDMRLKTRHEHPENQRWEMHQQLLKKQQEELEKKVDDLKKQQEETEEAKACLKLDKLMKEVWTMINSVLKQLVWKTKSHKIKIRLFTEYLTSDSGQWTFSEDYMPPEFLSKVKALQIQIQWEYDQYKLHLHSEQYIEKDSDEYIQLITQEVEPKWFQNLKRRASDAVQLKNCKLPQRD